jgi:predicted nucleic acid-binding protein
MRKLVDTCGWIEWLTNGHLADAFGPYVTKPTDLLIPTLVQYELYKWICREKSINYALEIIGATEEGTIIAVDTSIALYAADIAKQYNLAMADAIIYATSKKYNALLITSDKHFESLPDVKFFKKESITSIKI